MMTDRFLTARPAQIEEEIIIFSSALVEELTFFNSFSGRGIQELELELTIFTNIYSPQRFR